MLNICSQLLERNVFRVTICVLLMLSFASCDKNDGIGLNQGSDIQGVVTDTMTVHTSTFLLDSLPTAANGVLLLGHIHDDQLGEIKAQPYFQITPDGITSASLTDEAELDSMSLRIKYSGYYYGDTSQTQQIELHQLSNRIELPYKGGIQEPEEQNVFSGSASLHNVSHFPYNSKILGQLSYKPKPTSRDTVLIPMDMALGRQIFDLIKNSDRVITNTEEWLDYFKGLTLVAKGNSGNSIIGFTDTLQVKMYYKYDGTDGLKKNGELTFSLYNNAYQFNGITSDKSSTVIKNISLDNREIKANAANGNTFIQGGIGLVTRLEIPYLSYLSQRERTAINKAELVVQVQPNQENLFTLPPQLVLLVANQYRKPVSVLTDPLSNKATLDLRAGNSIGSVYEYTFPLTDYVSRSNTTYNNSSLFLSLPVSDLSRSMTRVILGSPDNPKATVKLKITYTNLNL